MERLQVLALDHYFDQDLRALEAHPRLRVRRFPYQRLRGPALRMLGSAVATSLEAYNRADLEQERRRYARWLFGEVRRLYLEQAFDVIVLPSDTFFYVRSLPSAAHAPRYPRGRGAEGDDRVGGYHAGAQRKHVGGRRRSSPTS